MYPSSLYYSLLLFGKLMCVCVCRCGGGGWGGGGGCIVEAVCVVNYLNLGV